MELFVYYSSMAKSEKCHGWHDYKKEGIAELERILSFVRSKRDEELIHLVESYIELYKDKKICKKKDINAVRLYPDLIEESARKKAIQYLEEKVESSKNLEFLEKKSVDKAADVFLKNAKTNKNLRKELEKPAHDKASRQVKKLREFLDNFYASEEGQMSEYGIYFVSDGRDYRLGIKKRLSNDNISESQMKPANDKIHWLLHVEKKIFDFLKIYSDVWRAFPCFEITQWIMKTKVIQWIINVTIPRNRYELCYQNALVEAFKQDAIINRVKNCSHPAFNALLALTFSMSIVALFFWESVSHIEMLLTFPFIPEWQEIVNWAKKKIWNILVPGLLITFVYILVSSFVLQVIYKLFGGKSSFYETFNLNLYFFSAWIPLVVKGALLSITPVSLATSRLFCVLFPILVYAVASYVATLIKLMSIPYKNGIPAFLLFILIHILFVKPFF